MPIMETRSFKAPAGKDINIKFLHGASFHIAAGKTRQLPGWVMVEAIKAGAIPVDNHAPERMKQVEPPPPPPPKQVPKTTEEIQTEIDQVVLGLIRENNPDNFTENGPPRAAIVVDAIGYNVPAAMIKQSFEQIKADLMAVENGSTGQVTGEVTDDGNGE